MPQRMLHLLHVVTAFMAKWLTGHGRLRLFLRPRMVHPPIHIHIHIHIPIPMPIPNPIHSLWPVVPFAVACHVQAIRMFQKCFGHGSFCGSGSVYLPFRLAVLLASSGGSSRRHRGGCTTERSWRWATYLCAYLKINVNSFIYFLCQIKRFKGYIASQHCSARSHIFNMGVRVEES